MSDQIQEISRFGIIEKYIAVMVTDDQKRRVDV